MTPPTRRLRRAELRLRAAFVACPPRGFVARVRQGCSTGAGARPAPRQRCVPHCRRAAAAPEAFLPSRPDFGRGSGNVALVAPKERQGPEQGFLGEVRRPDGGPATLRGARRQGGGRFGKLAVRAPWPGFESIIVTPPPARGRSTRTRTQGPRRPRRARRGGRRWEGMPQGGPGIRGRRRLWRARAGRRRIALAARSPRVYGREVGAHGGGGGT
jgi:hypothetical protein